MKLGQKIQLFISLKKITQTDFAVLCGWENQGRVNHYIHERREPNLSDIKKMAQVMNTTPEWLAFDMGASPAWLPEYQYPIELGLIPLVSLDKVGKNRIAEPDKTTTYLSFNNPNLIAVQVRGNAMVSINEPRLSLYEGDTVIVDKEAKPQHGDIVLAIQKGEEEAILRNYSVEGKKINLIPLDTKNYPFIPIEDIERICGVVIFHGGIKKNYRPELISNIA